MESLMESVGPCGLYQKLYILLCGSVAFIPALGFYSTVFNTAEPKMNCYLRNDEFDNDNSTSAAPELCTMWNNYTSSRDLNLSSPYHCEFKDDYYNLTIVNDWELVCEKQYLTGLTQTFFFMGTVCACINGAISDKFGRKRACSIFLILISLFTLIYQFLMLDLGFISLSNWHKYIVYCVYQFLSSLLHYCLFPTIFVLLIEVTTHKYHILFGNFSYYFFIIGEYYVLLAFYLFRNWKISNYFITGYILISSITFIILTPESARWLYDVKRYDEAFEVLKKIARVNGSKRFLKTFSQESAVRLMQSEQKDSLDYSLDDFTPKNESLIKKVMGNRYKFLKLLGLLFIWNAISLNYVGISIGITTVLDIDPFLMFGLSSLFEFFGVAACHLNDRIGRKYGMILYLLVLSTSSILVSVLPDDSEASPIKFLLFTKVCLAMLGRLTVASAFNTAYVYTSELYDVDVRNTMVLFLNCAGAFCSFASPQINSLKTLVWKPLPYLIYSSTAYLSVIIIFFLPDTHHFEYKN